MENFILESFAIFELNGEHDIRLNFYENKKIIVSENGIGKTTILNIFNYFFEQNEEGLSNYKFDRIAIKFKDMEEFYLTPYTISLIFNKNNLNNFREINNKHFISLFQKKLLNEFFSHKKSLNKNYISSFSNSTISLIILFIINNDRINHKSFYEISELISKEFNVSQEKSYKFTIDLRKLIDDFSINHKNDRNNINYNIKYRQNNKLDLQNFLFEDNYLDTNESIIKKISSTFDTFEKLAKTIESLKKINILYFPTYRRIEHEIDSLFKNDLKYNYKIDKDDMKNLFNNSPLIKFGVNDVSLVWDSLKEKINKSLLEGFDKFSGTMLKDSIVFKKVDQEQIDKLINKKETIRIVLDRLGSTNISSEDKEAIINIINDDNSFKSQKYDLLFYLLDNLIKIYESHEDIDIAIKRFIKVSNNYFKNKNVIYNESTATIEILKEYKNQNKVIKLNNLSSGEKQIISLFTKLYLTDLNSNNKYWIIFDEPELSLSIEWQKTLLPDILKSDRCELLFVATHSPFIFSNELKNYTTDLELEIKESNNES